MQAPVARQLFVTGCLLLVAACPYTQAFTPNRPTVSSTQQPTLKQQQQSKQHLHQKPLSVAVLPPDETTAAVTATTAAVESLQYMLSKEDTSPLIRIGEGDAEKIVNAFGLWCAAVSILTGPIWMAAMMTVQQLARIFDEWDPNRSVYDATGKVWAKTWLTMTDSFPTIDGEPLQKEGACLYVANHASWLDIPVLCTVLDPVFKFIAKGELRKVPCIGQQLEGGNHILIDREDRRSQLRTFKDGLAWLNKGVPIMAFPEGMRSRDGRLMEFKKGLFSLAVKAKVPIIPITLSNTHAVMPGFSFFPVQRGAGKIHVHVGAPISADGRTEAELEVLVRQEFLEHLPASQQPLPVVREESVTAADAVVV